MFQTSRGHREPVSYRSTPVELVGQKTEEEKPAIFDEAQRKQASHLLPQTGLTKNTPLGEHRIRQSATTAVFTTPRTKRSHSYHLC